MARVPTYDSFQVAPNALPQARFDGPAAMPSTPDFAGQQAQQIGQSLTQAGRAAGAIALDMQNEANHLRVIDASNKAKEQMFDLIYDKDAGLLNQKGINALERASGKDLPTEYGERFSEAAGKMAAGLGNDAQRAMFAEQVASMRVQLHGTAMQHLSGEFARYQVSTYDGTVATAQREIALMGASGNIGVDPATGRSKLDDAGDRILAAVRQKGRLMGLSAEQSDVEARKALSNAHLLAIGGALEQGKIDYADTYMRKYIDQMDADDILRVKGKIDGEVNNLMGSVVADDTLRKMAPRIHVGDAERLFNVMIGAESGGRQFAADGRPITSPKGAIGIAQVMPETGPEAAKFAGLPWDEYRYKNDAAYNKALGMAYFQKQLQDNDGDMQKAMAAYNAGPAAVQNAVKKAEQSVKLNRNDPAVQVHTWLDFMPAETRAYVSKNTKAYEAGFGQPPRPTVAEIDDVLRADPRLAGNPRRYQAAREEAVRRLDEQTKAIKQRDDESVANAMRAIVENGGRYSDLPASIRGALPPKEVDNVINFAQKISKGDDTSSMWLYGKLSSNPGALARMSDAEFYALRRELSEADFKHFSTERAKLTGTAPGGSGPGDINSQAIKQTLDQRLRMLKIDPSPKDDGGKEAARVGGIRRFVDQYFITAQREAGKKFSDAEIALHIDALFAKNATFRGYFWDSSGPMLAMKVGDLPSGAKDDIRAAFKRQGVDDPTDAQIMNAYWMMKVARK